jgi:hypothetical protein
MEQKEFYTGFELKNLYMYNKQRLESILDKISNDDLYLYWEMMEGYNYDVFKDILIPEHKFYLIK